MPTPPILVHSFGGQNSIANLALVTARGAPFAIVSLPLIASALGARLPTSALFTSVFETVLAIIRKFHVTPPLIGTALGLAQRLTSIAVLEIPGLLIASALAAKSNAEAVPALQGQSIAAHLVALIAPLFFSGDAFADAIETPFPVTVAPLLLTAKARVLLSEMDDATSCVARCISPALAVHGISLHRNKVADGVLVTINHLSNAPAAVRRRARSSLAASTLGAKGGNSLAVAAELAVVDFVRFAENDGLTIDRVDGRPLRPVCCLELGAGREEGEQLAIDSGQDLLDILPSPERRRNDDVGPLISVEWDRIYTMLLLDASRPLVVSPAQSVHATHPRRHAIQMISLRSSNGDQRLMIWISLGCLIISSLKEL